MNLKKQACKLQATLVRNYDPLTDSLTGVKCRATSVAKKLPADIYMYNRPSSLQELLSELTKSEFTQNSEICQTGFAT